MKAKVIIIEGCDFCGFPVGGQLSFAKHLVQAFGERLALVGYSTDDTPVGVWTKKAVDGLALDFFSIGRVDPLVRKPLLPRRLDVALRLRRYKKRILAIGIDAAFVLSPEVMITVADWGLRLCYKFSGVENPLAMPRYRAGKLLAVPFERRLFAVLADHAELIIAAADKKAIDQMVVRSRGVLPGSRIVQFPTRVDTKIFNIQRDRKPGTPPVFISCGRLNHVKGWDLVLAAFRHVRDELPAARLCFVGDGEDRGAVENEIARAGLRDSVTVTGFIDPEEVAGLLNSADVFVLGSHREGWPIAMLEALACGLPAVTTDVSGARELVAERSNGYVVVARDAREFAGKMIAALELERPNPVSAAIAQDYALDRMQSALENLWPPFRG
jgi:glycosyltransferase involved in cell wall biosynthesis